MKWDSVGQYVRKHLITKNAWDAVFISILIIGTLYLYVGGIGTYPLWDPWEPKYAQAMREMDRRNDFITPYLDGKIRWAKPILFYWAMYLPMRIGGNSEFTARLPSGIAATLGVVAIYFFVKKLWRRRMAMMAACILATTPQYVYMARQAMPDMLLTFFFITAMGFLALAHFSDSGTRGYFALFYASVALAFLTKGPVIGVICLGAIMMFSVIDIETDGTVSPKWDFSNFTTFLKSYHVGLGIVIFLIIAGPWYFTILVKHGYIFIDSFFRGENIHRFVEPVRGHHGLVTYYLRTLFHGLYPWSGFLPAVALFTFHGINGVEKERKKRGYFICWGLSIFLTFTIAGTKQQHYILPLTPVVAVLVAMVWEQYFRQDRPFWIPFAFLMAIAFMFLPIRDFLIEGNAYIFDNFTNRRNIDTGNLDIFIRYLFALWALVMGLAVFIRRSRVIVVLAVLIAYGNGIYFCHYVFPAHTKSRNVKNYIEYYVRGKKPETRFIFYGKMRASMNYYYRKDKYRHFERGEKNSLVAYAKSNRHMMIIAEGKFAEKLLRRLRKETDLRWRLISMEHPRYWLISGSPWPSPPVIRSENPENRTQR